MKSPHAFLSFAFALGFVGTSSLIALPSPGLKLWLDASDGTTIIVDGSGNVQQWSDKSGLGNHATQATAANRPVVNATALGGQPAVRFDGVNDGLSIADGLVVARPYTVFIVDQYSGATQGRTLQSRDAGVNWLIGKWAGNNAHYANPFVHVAGPGTTTIGEGIGYTNSSDYILNGNHVSTGGNGSGVTSPGHLGLGSSGTFPAEQSTADVAEIIVYDRTLTLTERREVGTYLQSKYGIAGAYTFARKDTFSVGQFTGGDIGEGLDLDGTFLYAVNFGEPGHAPLPIGDATFTPHDGTPGLTFTAPNQIVPGGWADVEFGATTNDNNLERVMESIRWTGGPGPATFNLSGLTVGERYKLELLFVENSGNRGFDIDIEGEMILENFFPVNVQGGLVNPDPRGAVFTYEFLALDNTLNIALRGTGAAGTDINPILGGLTLQIAAPEPSSILLGLIGASGLLWRRRRQA